MNIYQTGQQALCWLTECTLATVEWMEGQSRPGKTQLGRQRRMVAGAIANLRHLGFSASDAEDLHCGRVAIALQVKP